MLKILSPIALILFILFGAVALFIVANTWIQGIMEMVRTVWNF